MAKLSDPNSRRTARKELWRDHTFCGGRGEDATNQKRSSAMMQQWREAAGSLEDFPKAPSAA